MGKTAMMPKARAAEMAPLYALMPKGGEEDEAKTMRGRRRSGGKRSEGSKGGGERKKGAALGPRGDRRPMPRRDVPTHPAERDEGWVFPGRKRRRARWWQRERQCFSGNRRVFHPLNPSPVRTRAVDALAPEALLDAVRVDPVGHAERDPGEEECDGQAAREDDGHKLHGGREANGS